MASRAGGEMKGKILETVESWRSILVGLSGIIALVGGGLLWFDGRYTLLEQFHRHAEAEQQETAGTRALVYQGRQSQLEEQKFRIELAAESRRLTALERERLANIIKELEQLRRTIEQLQQKAYPK